MIKAAISWLDAEHGGRTKPFLGSIYTATARRADGSLESIVLMPYEPSSALQPISGVVMFGKLMDGPDPAPGLLIEITEGSRTVAICKTIDDE